MKIIITGATGLVGEGVLLVCLRNPAVEEVLVIGRKLLTHKHEKLKELIVKDFSEIKSYATELNGYDACFFCAGASSVGETEESFTKKTYDFVVPFAKILSQINTKMTFIYVSGNRTDSTEKGKVMWARVKGKTENALLRLPFHAVYHFRPGFMRPVNGQKNVRFIYHIFDGLSPVWYLFFPGWICKMEEVGLAMIHCASKGYSQPVLEVADIKIAAR